MSQIYMPQVRLPANTLSAARFLAGGAEQTGRGGGGGARGRAGRRECVICIVLLVLSGIRMKTRQRSW